MDTYAADLHELVTSLNLGPTIHVGHSTGGGEVACYIRNCGTKRVAKAVLVPAVPPLMLKTPANPGGTPISVFDGLRASVRADRSLFWMNLALPFYGYNRPGRERLAGRYPGILAPGDGVQMTLFERGSLRDCPTAMKPVQLRRRTPTGRGCCASPRRRSIPDPDRAGAPGARRPDTPPQVRPRRHR